MIITPDRKDTACHGICQLGHSRPTSILLALLLLLISSFTTSCTPDVTVKTDQQLQQDIQSAINTLAEYPAEWGAVGTNLLNEVNQIQSSFASEVHAVVTNALTLAQTYVQCDVDIMGVRLHDGLNYVLMHDIRGKPAPLPTPWVCAVAPDANPPGTVEVKGPGTGGPWSLVSPQILQVVGYNFYSGDLPALELVDASGRVWNYHLAPVRISTPYLIEIDLQSAQFCCMAMGDQLMLDWPEAGTPSNTISILYACPFCTGGSGTSKDVGVSDQAPGWGCHAMTYSFSPQPGFKFDTYEGDPGPHQGVKQLQVLDSGGGYVTDYNYQAVTSDLVQITGRNCSKYVRPDHPLGPPQVFSRIYRLFEIPL